MMKQLKLHLQVDEDQLWTLCKKLPLDLTDRKVAFALAVLCATTGSYVPDRGVGQKEIASLADLSVRTVKRRLPHLVRYGILNIDRSNGRSNVYQISLEMLFDAPPLTHNIKKPIHHKTDTISETDSKSKNKSHDRQQFLFEVGECAAPHSHDANSFLSWMTGAATRLIEFTKRLFSVLLYRSGAKAGPTSQEPGPSSHKIDSNQCQTGANVSQSGNEPGPSSVFGAGIVPEPGPTTPEPVPNRGQTGAISTLHTDTSIREPPLIKKSTSNIHVHGGLDSNLEFQDSESTPGNEPDPPVVRKIHWNRQVTASDLKEPVELQELYEIAVSQGFILESEQNRIQFFGLAHYTMRHSKIRSKVGFFTSNIDRTVKDKYYDYFEFKLTKADENWASNAIHQYDFPPIT